MLEASKYHHLPCQILAGTTYKTDVYETDNATFDVRNLIGLMVSFPDKIKIITQSQEVDIQALIGYIGGYIGLFLGNIYFSQIVYIMCCEKNFFCITIFKNLYFF